MHNFKHGVGVIWLPKRIEGSKIKVQNHATYIHAKPQLYKELLVNLTKEYYG